jgi:predicted transcriptional regulator
MPSHPANHLMSRSEKETETEASRLAEFVDEALRLVALRSNTDLDSLDSIADRIERSARNLSVALRELAHERRNQDERDRLAS